jgi:hypothetical protein
MLGIGDDKRVFSLLRTPQLAESLEAILDQLERCQKALADFLEQKPQSFPHFYFIGEDDLLEILGQAKNSTCKEAIAAFEAKAGIKAAEAVRLPFPEQAVVFPAHCRLRPFDSSCHPYRCICIASRPAGARATALHAAPDRQARQLSQLAGQVPKALPVDKSNR